MNFINMLQKKMIIGMIHVQALPGTPNNKMSISEIIKIAVQEAELYKKCGVDAIILENMHDVPYLNRAVGPEITASMTAIATHIKQKVSIPCGIQILAGANMDALAVAQASSCEFIRAEGFVFSHIADEGLMNADAAELLRYRKLIGAENINIITDIKKKHSSHQLTSDVSIAEFASAAEFFLSDGLIITGVSTSSETDINDLKQVRATSKLPILIGSGITDNNIRKYWNLADGFIIGSYFKEDGNWKNPVSKDRIDKLMQTVSSITS